MRRPVVARFHRDSPDAEPTYQAEIGGQTFHGQAAFDLVRRMALRSTMSSREDTARTQRPGRAPRPATNHRRQGSRRASGGRSPPDDPELDEPPPARRLDGRRGIERWLAERKAALDRLTNDRGQLGLFGEEAA